MKICPNCGSSFDDSMRFCVQCGTALAEQTEQVVSEAVPEAETVADTAPETAQAPQPEYQAAPQYQPAPGYVPPYQAPVPNPNDHTGEMDPADIQENKLYALLVYLLFPVGVIIALLADKDSAFLKFHIKLSIKYFIVQFILLLISCTVILSIPAAIFMMIAAVLEIITIVQVCKGEAKDPAIIRSIKFLN